MIMGDLADCALTAFIVPAAYSLIYFRKEAKTPSPGSKANYSGAENICYFKREAG
jgi:hypothetical protein